MSAVLCLPACLCMSAAASRGQAPHGNVQRRQTNWKRSLLLRWQSIVTTWLQVLLATSINRAEIS